MEDELKDHPDLVNPNHYLPCGWHVGEEGWVSCLHIHYEYGVYHVRAEAEAHQNVEYHEWMIKDLASLATLTLSLRYNELEKVSYRQD